MRLSELTDDRAEVKVDYRGKVVAVTYRPGALTPAREEELAAATEAGLLAANQQAGKLLEDLLVDWDLYADQAAEDAGDRLPTTAEVIRNLPSGFVAAVFEAVRTDMAPLGRRTSAGG